jgi:hypothetical protein
LNKTDWTTFNGLSLHEKINLIAVALRALEEEVGILQVLPEPAPAEPPPVEVPGDVKGEA